MVGEEAPYVHDAELREFEIMYGGMHGRSCGILI